MVDCGIFVYLKKIMVPIKYTNYFARRETMGRVPYRTFNAYLKEKWGERVWRLCLNAGRPCPNRQNGKPGCAFCSGDTFLPYTSRLDLQVFQQMALGKELLGRRYGVRRFYAYFQSNSNTSGPLDEIEEMFSSVLTDGDIKGLIVATRPDMVFDDVITMLNRLARAFPEKDMWLELGLQSVFDKTLARVQRGHDYADFQSAAYRVKTQTPYKLAVHMIIGLPGERPHQIRDGFKKLFSENAIDGIKFQDLHVLSKTPLALDYAACPADFFRFSDNGDSYAEFIAQIILDMPENIIVMRTTADHPAARVLHRAAGINVEKHRMAARIGAYIRTLTAEFV